MKNPSKSFFSIATSKGAVINTQHRPRCPGRRPTTAGVLGKNWTRRNNQDFEWANQNGMGAQRSTGMPSMPSVRLYKASQRLQKVRNTTADCSGCVRCSTYRGTQTRANAFALPLLCEAWDRLRLSKKNNCARNEATEKMMRTRCARIVVNDHPHKRVGNAKSEPCLSKRGGLGRRSATPLEASRKYPDRTGRRFHLSSPLGCGTASATFAARFATEGTR